MIERFDNDAETFSVFVELAEGDAPPTEVRLLKNGVNKTLKGDIRSTPKAAKAVVAAAIAHFGKPELNFDYGHGQIGAGSFETARSAGWFTLEARGGELWATAIQWTKTALQALSDREFRFFSPTLFRDATGTVVKILNVALTNIPATVGLEPLVASQEAAGSTKENLMDPELQALLARAGVTSLSQAATAFDALKAENATLLDAAKQINADLATAEAKIEAFSAQKLVDDREALITKLSADGKLAPAMKPWAQTQSIKSLTAFGAVAAPVAAPAAVTPPESEVVELSQADKDVAKALGNSYEFALEAKKAELKAKGAV